MREVARLLNRLVDSGVLSAYALFGATAQMRYTEPVATLDADVLIVPSVEEGLDVLSPIYEYCAGEGFQPEREAIRVGSWPVQFIPVFDSLTREAVDRAETVDFEGEPFRVVRADHLAVIALKAGRPKDFARILALFESESTTPGSIAELAARHDLLTEWERFRRRFLDE